MITIEYFFLFTKRMPIAYFINLGYSGKGSTTWCLFFQDTQAQPGHRTAKDLHVNDAADRNLSVKEEPLRKKTTNQESVEIDSRGTKQEKVETEQIHCMNDLSKGYNDSP